MNKGTKYTKEQLKSRAIRRTVQVIYEQWEEGTGIHSRLFGTLIAPEYLENGQSINGGGYREHVVPCALIRDECLRMYDNGATVDDAAHLIDKHLRIVRITAEEANHIDHILGLKVCMPDGWVFGTGDPLERLNVAGIIFEDEPCYKT